MPWLDSNQKKLLWQFLEFNPPKNRKGNLGIRNLSFYSSELKNVLQIIEELKRIQDGTFGDGKDDKTKQRYLNTLSNLRLVDTDDGEPMIRAPGQRIIEFTEANPALLEDVHREDLSIAIDEIIFTALLDDLRSGALEGMDRGKDFFLQLLQNAQDFFDGIALEDRQSVTDDLDQLFFLQSINALGFEVPRFFRLANKPRAESVEAWEKALDHFPTIEPTDDFEKTVFLYLEPIAKKRIQKDIRYRVKSFLAAYLGSRKRLKDAFPRLDPNKRIVNQARASGAHTLHRTLEFKLTQREEKPVIEQPHQWLVNGCPGSGKSYYVDNTAKSIEGAHIIRTTFHAETSYFDFIGSYKPSPIFEQGDYSLIDSEGNNFPLGRPLISYDFFPGPMIQALTYAMLNEDWSIILIIEELNRANSSAVFGDFFQLLDRDSNAGESLFPIKPHPDLSSFLSSFGIQAEKGIRLPNNLFLWATMNNADQGVFPLDSAFRRRWDFEYQGHGSPCEYSEERRKLKYAGKSHDWEEFRRRINAFLISEGVHEDKLLGPYFLTEAELENPRKVLYKLFLYLWEDALRFQHKKLMDFDSFDELERTWDNGEGAPMKILTE